MSSQNIDYDNATKNIEDLFFESRKAQDEILEKGAKGIIDYFDNDFQPLSLSFQLKRLVARLSDYPKDSEMTDKKCKEVLYGILDKNKSIQNGIRLTKDTLYTREHLNRWINDALCTQRTKMHRYKIFVLSIALNLEYKDVVILLQKGAEEREFNYRNPYEVILAFCFSVHKNMYELYTELREKYEASAGYDDSITQSTKFYKDVFHRVHSKDELLDMIAVLPNDTSKSARREFIKLYDELVSLYNDSDVSDIIDKASSVADNYGAIALKLLIFKYNINDNPIRFNDITKDLFGTTTVRKKSQNKEPVKFDFLKENYAMTANELEKAYKNTDIVPPRSYIVSLGFLLYVKKQYWANAVNSFSSSNDELKNVFFDFSNYINPILIRAGYNDFYLLNTFDLFVMRCLYTTNPIQSFREVMMYKEDKDD